MVRHPGCAGTLQRRGVCARGHRPEVPAAALEVFWDSGDFWERAAPHLAGLKCAGMRQKSQGAWREERGGVAAGADKVMSGWAFGEKRSLLLGNGSAAWIASLLHLLPCKAEPARRKWGTAS